MGYGFSSLSSEGEAEVSSAEKVGYKKVGTRSKRSKSSSVYPRTSSTTNSMASSSTGRKYTVEIGEKCTLFVDFTVPFLIRRDNTNDSPGGRIVIGTF